MRQDSKPAAQKFHRENAERLFLADLVADLAGKKCETGQISKPSEFKPGANYSSRDQGSRQTRKICRNILHEILQIG
jgi:hypothetical protein